MQKCPSINGLKLAYHTMLRRFLGHDSTLQRTERAMNILVRDGIYQWSRIAQKRYSVRNLDNDSVVEYFVDLSARTCTCPDSVDAGNICKHRQACELIELAIAFDKQAKGK